MGGFLSRLQSGLQNLMIGRYGIDRLSIALIVAALVINIIGSFTGLFILTVLSLTGIVYALYRCYSRDIGARERELAAFERAVGKPSSWLSLQMKRWRNRSTTLYFTCKKCGTVYSVPKGKGKVRVTCPTCHEKTIHTT